jgi:hypothetical protein
MRDYVVVLASDELEMTSGCSNGQRTGTRSDH